MKLFAKAICCVCLSLASATGDGEECKEWRSTLSDWSAGLGKPIGPEEDVDNDPTVKTDKITCTNSPGSEDCKASKNDRQGGSRIFISDPNMCWRARDDFLASPADYWVRYKSFIENSCGTKGNTDGNVNAAKDFLAKVHELVRTPFDLSNLVYHVRAHDSMFPLWGNKYTIGQQEILSNAEPNIVPGSGLMETPKYWKEIPDNTKAIDIGLKQLQRGANSYPGCLKYVTSVREQYPKIRAIWNSKVSAMNQKVSEHWEWKVADKKPYEQQARNSNMISGAANLDGPGFLSHVQRMQQMQNAQALAPYQRRAQANGGSVPKQESPPEPENKCKDTFTISVSEASEFIMKDFAIERKKIGNSYCYVDVEDANIHYKVDRESKYTGKKMRKLKDIRGYLI